MQGSNNPTNTNSINIEMISPKQLIGQCLDFAAIMLREIIDVFCNNNKIDPPINQKNDFSISVSFILDPSRFDKIVESFVKVDVISKKQFIKTWVNELRNYRNAWAHWAPDTLDYRMAGRAYETLSLLFALLGGNFHSDLFQKIEMYRKKLLFYNAQKQFFGGQHHYANN